MKNAAKTVAVEAMAETANAGTILQIAEKAQAALTEKAEASLTAMQEVGQTLAQVADLENEGKAKSREAKELASKAAFGLFNARTNGLVSNEQITSILGDKFGYKEKGENADKSRPVLAGSPNASKTPFGEGEAIRKRVVRAIDAFRFVVSNGEDATSFFEGLDIEAVKTVLSDIDAGKSIYTAYDEMTEIRKNGNPTIAAPFNVATIMKQTARLTEGDVADKLRENPDLILAYKALSEQIERLMSAPADAEIAF